MSMVYMLDTNICSFIMRQRPSGLIDRLQTAVERQDRIVISAITYYEMLAGTIGRKTSPHHAVIVERFVMRLSGILSWGRRAAEEATRIRKELAAKGTPIGGNDAMIAGHAVATDCVLVTNNMREFSRVNNLQVEDWTGEL